MPVEGVKMVKNVQKGRAGGNIFLKFPPCKDFILCKSCSPCRTTAPTHVFHSREGDHRQTSTCAAPWVSGSDRSWTGISGPSVPTVLMLEG